MFAKLKSRTAVPRVVGGLVLILIAAAFLINLLPTLRLVVSGPQDLYSLTVDEMAGAYVRADIQVLYDSYAETVTENGETGQQTLHSREYVSPTADGYYIGIQVPAAQVDTAELVLEDTYLWVTDPDYEWNGVELHLTGTIETMDFETENLYHGMLREYYEMTDAELESFRPLLLIPNKIGAMELDSLVVLSLLTLAMFVLGVVLIVFGLTGHCLRKMEAYIAAQPDPEGARQEIERVYEETAPNNGLRTSRNWVVYEKGGQSWVLATRDIAWVYMATVTQRAYGIKVGQRHSVKVCSLSEPRNRRRHEVFVRNQAQAEEVMAQLKSWAPQAVYGYDPVWDRLYDKDPQAFLAASREPQTPPQQTPPPAPPAPETQAPAGPKY